MNSKRLTSIDLLPQEYHMWNEESCTASAMRRGIRTRAFLQSEHDKAPCEIRCPDGVVLYVVDATEKP